GVSPLRRQLTQVLLHGFRHAAKLSRSRFSRQDGTARRRSPSASSRKRWRAHRGPAQFLRAGQRPALVEGARVPHATWPPTCSVADMSPSQARSHKTLTAQDIMNANVRALRADTNAIDAVRWLADHG